MPSGDDFDAFLSKANSDLELFTALDVDELSNACGEDATSTMSNVESFSDDLSKLANDFSKVYDHMSCETVGKLVQKTVYEVSCNSISKGLLWTFISGLCLAAFGTILISLRSATQRPQIYLVSANKAELADDDSYIVGDDDSRY